jgi:hypothetical protein
VLVGLAGAMLVAASPGASAADGAGLLGFYLSARGRSPATGDNAQPAPRLVSLARSTCRGRPALPGTPAAGPGRERQELTASGCPQRITELRDRRPVQVTRGKTAGVHPAAQTTGHRQHADNRARGIPRPASQARYPSMKGPILPGFRRRPLMTGLHSPSTLFRQQKPRPAYGTMPIHLACPTPPEAQARSVHVTPHTPRHSSRIGIDPRSAPHRRHRGD